MLQSTFDSLRGPPFFHCIRKQASNPLPAWLILLPPLAAVQALVPVSPLPIFLSLLLLLTFPYKLAPVDLRSPHLLPPTSRSPPSPCSPFEPILSHSRSLPPNIPVRDTLLPPFSPLPCQAYLYHPFCPIVSQFVFFHHYKPALTEIVFLPGRTMLQSVVTSHRRVPLPTPPPDTPDFVPA